MTTATTLRLAVSGMHCASCGLLVDDVVEDLAGVQRCQTDTRHGHTVVQADLAMASVEAIVAAIAGLGYHAEPMEA